MTTRTSTWSPLASGLALAASLLGHAADANAQGAPAGSAMDDEARRLYDEARKAKDKSDFATCTAKMRAAWALKKHRQVAGLLGECELKTGAHRDAAEHLAYYLDRSSDAAPEVVATVQALYDQARAEVAVVTVKASAVDADRKVDGKQLAPDERRVFLVPGEHVFAASKAGGGSAEKRIFVAAGQEREVMLELETAKEAPATPPPTSAPPPTQPSSEESSGPSMLPGIVAGSVGLVGVGVGIALLAASGSAGSDADALAQEIDDDGGACPGDGPAPAGFETRCADFDSAAGDEATFGTIGVISLIGGGVLLAGGVGWTVWAATSDGDSESVSHVTITPHVGLGGAGLGASGSF